MSKGFSSFCQQVASVFEMSEEIMGCVQAQELSLREGELEAVVEVQESRWMGMILRNSC